MILISYIQADPNNIRALALLAYSNRMLALQGGAGAPQNAQQAAEFGKRGLAALQTMQKPDGVSDADFAKLAHEDQRGLMNDVLRIFEHKHTL